MRMKKIKITVLFLIVLWLGGYVLFSIMAFSAKPQDILRHTDAIIVLTGGQGRIETGLALLMEGRATSLFITGVHPHVKPEEINELWTGNAPLPACCIKLGYEARTTQQNAKETKDWLAREEITSIRLVTGNFHMPRARVEFNHALDNIDIIPHPIIQPKFEHTKPRYWTMSFGEYHKTLFRWLMMHFEGILPDALVNPQLNPEEKPEAILQ